MERYFFPSVFRHDRGFEGRVTISCSVLQVALLAGAVKRRPNAAGSAQSPAGPTASSKRAKQAEEVTAAPSVASEPAPHKAAAPSTAVSQPAGNALSLLAYGSESESE